MASVVKQTSGTAAGGEYGFHGIEVTSTAGNALVLLAAWDCSYTYTPQENPAAYVSDSAGNYWVHAGTSDPATLGARVTGWVCTNAQAIEWLSCSLSGFATTLAYSLIELSGLPSLVEIDGLGTASSPGTSLVTSLSATTTVSAPQNMVQNPGFETGSTSPWTAANGAVIAVETTHVHSGTYALSVTTGTAAYPNVESNKIPVSAGQLWTGSIWALADATLTYQVNVQIAWYDSTQAYVSASSGTATTLSTSTWTELSVTATVPTGISYASVGAVIGSAAPTAGEICYVDDGVLTQADFAFAVLGVGDTAATISTQPAGWTAEAAVSAGGVAPNGIQLFTYWEQGVPAGSLAATWALNKSAPAAALVFTIGGAPAAPAQPNPNFPLLKVEAAWGHLPGDTSSPPPMWTDITQYTMSRDGATYIKTSYGQQYELATPEAGELEISLSNVDGRFTPYNSSSPYYTNCLTSNFDFETGAAGWTGINVTIAQSSNYSYEGAYSLQIVAAGGVSNPYVHSSGASITNFSALYCASAWVFLPSAYSSGVYAELVWSTSGGTTISTQVGPTIIPQAQTWTQVKVSGAPAAGSAFAVLRLHFAGTPAAGTTMYADMAGVALGGCPVQDDLVRVGTPVRVSAYWSGMWHHVAYGYAERWPNDWPDLPQWGFSKMVAIDAVGILNSVTMPSALAGEVLVDAPYAYFHGDEQYMTVSNGINLTFSSAEANGLPAVNYSRYNQRSAFYVDGSSAPVQTGMALNLQGDSGTGFGTTGAPTTATSTVTCGGLVYPDPSLPSPLGADGLTVEFWFQYSSGYPLLFSAYAPPSAFRSFYGFNTPSFAIQASSVPPQVGYQLLFNGAGFTGSPTFYSNDGSAATTHCVCVFQPLGGGTSTTFTMYLNGASAYTTSLPQTELTAWSAIALGSAQYAYSYWPAVGATGNYTGGHYAVYDYAMNTQRIANHYEIGGLGDQGDTAMERIGEILTWGNVGIPRGGPLTKASTYDGTYIAQAYSLEGTTAADAINQIVSSDRGLLAAMPSGTLRYLFKWWTLNVPSSVTFGDDAAAPLNYNHDFLLGVTGWYGFQSTISASTVYTNTTSTSAECVPAGGLATAEIVQLSTSQTAVTAGSAYVAQAWAYSPGGWLTCNVGVDWYTSASVYISTSSAAFSAPAATWVFAQTAILTAPATAAYARAHVAETGTPSPSDVFYVEQVWLTSAAEVPFEQASGFDFDNTYLYNNTDATLQQGPTTLISVHARDTTSQHEYFNRSALSETVQTTGYYDTYTVANWDLSKYKEPQIRVRQLAVGAAANPSQSFGAILGTRVGDVCTVTRRPIGGVPISVACMVMKVQHDIGPGKWDTTYQLSPYVPENQILTLDTSGYNVVGSNTLS